MAGLDMRGQGLGLGMMGMPDRSLITAVQQKDYTAGVWLRRKDKLEHVSSADWSGGLRNRWWKAEMLGQK